MKPAHRYLTDATSAFYGLTGTHTIDLQAGKSLCGLGAHVFIGDHSIAHQTPSCQECLTKRKAIETAEDMGLI